MPRGHGLWPSRTQKNDERINFRIDKGSDVDGKAELIMQPNKNAADSKVKQGAQKDSHGILAKGGRIEMILQLNKNAADRKAGTTEG
ncbi:hypothetical protein FQN57_001628 [Myotisia sp. PD_48]|nr:hypothetical protein FQN57_001628 [Myotisia sp. PD_48]